MVNSTAWCDVQQGSKCRYHMKTCICKRHHATLCKTNRSLFSVKNKFRPPLTFQHGGRVKNANTYQCLKWQHLAGYTNCILHTYFITMTSHACHGITNHHRQLDCLFKSLLMLAPKKTSKLKNAGPFCINLPVVRLTKGHSIRGQSSRQTTISEQPESN